MQVSRGVGDSDWLTRRRGDAEGDDAAAPPQAANKPTDKLASTARNMAEGSGTAVGLIDAAPKLEAPSLADTPSDSVSGGFASAVRMSCGGITDSI